MEFTLLAAAAIALGVVWLCLRLSAPADRSDLWNGAVSAVIAGIAFGRVWAMVRSGVNPVTNPGDLLIVRGGVDPAGATIGAVATLVVSLRSNLWPRLDALAPAAVAGLAGWHAGCVVRGACLGTPTGLPWGLAAPGSAITRHPVEIYATLLLLAGAVLVARRRGRPSGTTAALGFTLAAIVRLATEPLRTALSDEVRLLYAIGVVAGVGVLVWRWRTRAATPD